MIKRRSLEKGAQCSICTWVHVLICGPTHKTQILRMEGVDSHSLFDLHPSIANALYSLSTQREVY